MKRGRRRWLLSAVVPTVILACIPEPPPDLPDLPRARPTIVRASVVPSASSVIGRFPQTFIVPVELADPTETFFWVAFIDYNPLTGAGRQGAPQSSSFEPGNPNATGRIRTIFVDLAEPPPNRCHLIEVIVARSFGEDRTARRPVDPPGGDIVSWFYSPGGTLTGCPSTDAGFDAEFPPVDSGPP